MPPRITILVRIASSAGAAILPSVNPGREFQLELCETSWPLRLSGDAPEAWRGKPQTRWQDLNKLSIGQCFLSTLWRSGATRGLQLQNCFQPSKLQRLFLSASLKNPGNCWTGSVLRSSWTTVRPEPSAEISKWKEEKHHVGFVLKGMIPNPQLWNGRISPKQWFMSLPNLCSWATTWRHYNTTSVSLWLQEHYNILSLIIELLRLDKPSKIKSSH